MPELPTDPEAQEQWDALPKNKPSNQAMRPATGGTRWAFGLIVAIGVIVVIVGLLSQGGIF